MTEENLLKDEKLEQVNGGAGEGEYEAYVFDKDEEIIIDDLYYAQIALAERRYMEPDRSVPCYRHYRSTRKVLWKSNMKSQELNDLRNKNGHMPKQ